jgi:hypothetical protein
VVREVIENAGGRDQVTAGDALAVEEAKSAGSSGLSDDSSKLSKSQ